MRQATVFAATVLLAFAGAAFALPKPPPPRLGQHAVGPPPAWIETARGDHWLAYSSYCWASTCADFIARSCRELPRIVLRRGETVRFHLGFVPRSVTLGIAKRRFALRATATPTWRARASGAGGIFATVKGGGDASYEGCFVVR